MFSPRPSSRLRIGFTTLALCLWTTVCLAAEPIITSTRPNAIRPGQAIDITVKGKHLASATSLWTSFDSSAKLVEGSAKDTQVVFKVDVPAKTTPGVYGIRVATNQGISGLRLFVVDDLPSVVSAKARTIETAQEVKLPSAIDGIVDSVSISHFKFEVADGQRVSFEVLARRLGSALDPIMRILDATGREITYNDDAPGLSGDSRLSHTFEKAGVYVVELRDIRYAGGGGHFYRLRIGDFPCASVPYPLATQRGGSSQFELLGSDVDATLPINVNVPSESAASWINVATKRKDGNSSAFGVLAVGVGEEVTESEPNDDVASADRLTLGQSISGQLHRNGDSDRFVMAAKKNETWVFRGETRRLGSPVDLVLSVFKSDGGRVARADDSGVEDSILKYKFPADGDYILEVHDLHHRGGTQFAYRIETLPDRPGFSLSASADRINIPNGGTAAVTVSVVRDKYPGPIELNVLGHPQGIRVQPTVIGPGRNSVVMTLQHSGTAAAGTVYPIRIVGTGRDGQAPLTSQATITTALKASTNQLPWPPPVLEHDVAIGIAPQPKFVMSVSQPGLEFARKLKATVKVAVTRQPEIDEAITLAVTKDGLPSGISIDAKPIAKGQDEVQITFSANEKTPLGQYTVVLNATHKKGKQTIVQTVPGLTLTIAEPFQMTVEGFEHSIPSNGMQMFNVKLKRNAAFKSAVKLSFEGLPAGVSASAAEIAADKNEAQITLTAKDAKAASIEKIVVVGVGAGLTVKATAGPLKVE